MQPRCRMRVPVHYPASIQSDTEAGEGVLFDLSPAGCRMRSDIALNAGSYLTLRIAVAQEPTPLAVEVSVVRWCKDGHIGVEFLRYSQGDRERVSNLVADLPPIPIPIHSDHATSTLSESALNLFCHTAPAPEEPRRRHAQRYEGRKCLLFTNVEGIVVRLDSSARMQRQDGGQTTSLPSLAIIGLRRARSHRPRW